MRLGKERRTMVAIGEMVGLLLAWVRDTSILMQSPTGWYVMRYEASLVGASALGRRARRPEGGLALVRCLHPRSQPDPAGQCPRRAATGHRPAGGLRLP